MRILLSVIALTAAASASPFACAPWLDIVVSSDEPLVALAAAQLRRYLHVLDRRLCPARLVSLCELETGSLPSAPTRVYLTTADQASHPVDPCCNSSIVRDGFLFDTTGAPLQFSLIGSDAGSVLNGVSTILARLGVRFTAEGPMLPASAVVAARDAARGIGTNASAAWHEAAGASIVAALAAGGPLRGSPVFEYRGFQPWGSYPIGNDWWDVDEYRRVVETIATLRGNWMGMHDYANDYPFPEPGVAVLVVGSGLLPGGNLSAGGVAYTGTWAASERASWGLDGAPTGGYAYGAAALYDWDCYANRAVAGGDAVLCPSPTDASGAAETFNRVGALYASAFALAARLNISTALGTEIPLTLPPANDTEAVVPLYVWWSAARNDTFVTTTLCAECLGLYVFVGTAGYVYTSPGPGRVALTTYWASAYLDALLTVEPPSDPAYQFTRIEGYGVAGNGSAALSDGLLPLQQESRMYYKEPLGKSCIDTWAVAGANFTVNATARGYEPVGSPMASILATGPPQNSALFIAYNATLARMARLYGQNLTWYWAWTAVRRAGAPLLTREAGCCRNYSSHNDPALPPSDCVACRKGGSGTRFHSSIRPSLQH
jgi:hypothetical protein